MSAFFIWIISTAALLGVGLTLAYRRSDLATSTIVIGFALLAYTMFGFGHWLITLLFWALFAGMVSLNLPEFRRNNISAPLLKIYRTMVPNLSDTELESLEAGTVWWDGELFTGLPDWSVLTSLPPAQLTD